jgi:hypothetical protein
MAILLAHGPAAGAAVAAFNSCPRPSGAGGSQYETITGAFQARGVTAGGGKFLTILASDWAGPVSVNVVDEVFDATEGLDAGTRVTLVGYVNNSMSGAEPPYSCVELAH